MTDLYTWLLMYCAGAMGWLLFLGLPGAVAVFRSLNATRRIYFLHEKQKILINEWGDCGLPSTGVPNVDNTSFAEKASAPTPG